MINIKSLSETLKALIKNVLQNDPNLVTTLDLFRVTDNTPETYKVNIQQLTKPKVQYTNVPVAGVGLGNFKGLMILPKQDDLVIVGFLGPNRPIVLGMMFNSLDVEDANISEVIQSSLDQVPQLKDGEALIAPREKGAYMFWNEDGDIVIRNSTKSATVTISNGGGITISGSDVTLSTSGTPLGVARVGDTVEVQVTGGSSAGTYSGTITSSSTNVKAGD